MLKPSSSASQLPEALVPTQSPIWKATTYRRSTTTDMTLLLRTRPAVGRKIRDQGTQNSMLSCGPDSQGCNDRSTRRERRGFSAAAYMPKNCDGAPCGSHLHSLGTSRIGAGIFTARGMPLPGGCGYVPRCLLYTSPSPRD